MERERRLGAGEEGRKHREDEHRANENEQHGKPDPRHAAPGREEQLRREERKHREGDPREERDADGEHDAGADHESPLPVRRLVAEGPVEPVGEDRKRHQREQDLDAPLGERPQHHRRERVADARDDARE